MPARAKSISTRVRISNVEAPGRLGGETRPYEYPHLYQIQAGDWRISYAVERNRLAILVLEVLNADGTLAPDPVRETLTHKMKVKLLDWPEGSPSRDLRPEDLGRKVRIRLMDMDDEIIAPDGGAAGRPRQITVLDSGTGTAKAAVVQEKINAPVWSASQSPASESAGRKVTPLDSPTM